jgi:ABC-type lipoprotein release transport system permease subunit
MNIILTIAWRNIFRHKGKTLVIGIILFLGALIMTIGNGIISGLNEGLEKNIVNSFTGDLIIISENQLDDAVLLSMTGLTIKPINNYLDIKKELKTIPWIKAFLPAGIGYVWVLNDKGQPIDQYIFGIEFDKYQQFFNDSLEVLEGRLFEGNEQGVLVSSKMREWIYDYCGYWIIPQNESINKKNLTEDALKHVDNLDMRNELVFMGLSRKNTNLDILSKVIGVTKFKQLNSLLGFYSFVDIESFRECLGYFSAQDAKLELSSAEKSLLNEETDFLQEIENTIDTLKNTQEIEFDKSFFEKKKIKVHSKDLEKGVFNIIFIKLQDNITRHKAFLDLNQILKEKNLKARVIKWNKAMGAMGQMSLLMKGALFLFVFFIFFVAIIIIMNTLSMAAMERISEIGMMRAVGARKWLISRMFLAETLMLSASFGGLGILAGIAVVKILASLKLTTKNEILQIFYGGDAFHPLLDYGDILICIVLLIVVTLAAVIYPVMVARRITALDAISKE